MTVEQAQQILAGDPTQEELFTALLVLAREDETAYVAALPRAAELLAEMSGQEVSREDINTVVRQLQTQTQETQEPGTEVTLGETEAAPEVPQGATPQGAGGLTTGTTIAPPPVPPEEEDEAPEFQPPPFIGNVPAHHGRSVVSHPGQRVETVGGPRYRAGDEWDPSRLSPREIRRKQKELEKAGLLEPGSYIPGFWDKASADALNVAMGHANIQGGDVESILDELASLRPSQRETAEQFMPPPEVKPDPAAISQRVKREFRNQLGRDPTDQELAEFGGYLSGQFGAAHQAEVARARAEFEAEPATPEEVVSHPAQEVETVGGGGSTPGSFTAVNPAARFAELFDERFGPERDFIRDQAATFQASQRVMGTLSGLSRRIG